MKEKKNCGKPEKVVNFTILPRQPLTSDRDLARLVIWNKVINRAKFGAHWLIGAGFARS
jgi:hypothetical protein